MRKSCLAAILAALTIFGPGRASAQSPPAGADPGELKSLYEAALKEGGGVRLYSQIVPTTLELLNRQWNKRFPGVKLDYVRLTTAPLIERVNAELASGSPVADIVMVSDSVWPEDLYKAGKLAEYSIGAYKQWPPQYKREGFYFVSQLYLSSVIYNTNRVQPADAPLHYMDVFKFGKRASLTDPRAGGGNAAVMFGTMQMFGESFWKKAADAGVQYSMSVADVTPKILSGDVPAAINTNSLPACQESAGRAIKVVYPSEGVWPTPAVTFGTKGAAHPKAAELLLAYVMSDEGQSFINLNDCTYSVRPGVKLNSSLPPLESLKVIDITPQEWREHGEAYRQAAARAGGVPIN